MEESDAILVGRARQGDAGAFEVLVRRHLGAAYAVALAQLGEPADAEDVAQDALVAALEKLDDCHTPAHFRAWLLSIVRNRAHDHRRRRAVRAALPLEAASGATSSADPAHESERAELRAALLQAMQGLTPLQREVLLLYDVEGWSHREIAGRLGITDGSARVHLHHGRRALRQRLAGRYQEEG